MVVFKLAAASVDVIIVVFMGVVEVVLEVFCFIEVVCKSLQVAELQKEPFLCKFLCDTLYVSGIVEAQRPHVLLQEKYFKLWKAVVF